MNRLKYAVLVLLMAANGWAEVKESKETKVWMAATYYLAVDGTKCEPRSWCVVKGSETYSLDEFVESGRFCEFRGKHDWNLGFENEDRSVRLRQVYYCRVCARRRNKIKAPVEIESWEP